MFLLSVFRVCLQQQQQQQQQQQKNIKLGTEKQNKAIGCGRCLFVSFLCFGVGSSNLVFLGAFFQVRHRYSVWVAFDRVVAQHDCRFHKTIGTIRNENILF
jgi:hypothetical protein